MLLQGPWMEYKSSKYHPAIRSSSHVRKDRILKLEEPHNYRIQKHTWIWTALSTYIQMNSHICHWSPSFRVTIDCGRKGIDKNSEAKFSYGHAPRDYNSPLCKRFASTWDQMTRKWSQVTRKFLYAQPICYIFIESNAHPLYEKDQRG